jgi:hypothetical protein
MSDMGNDTARTLGKHFVDRGLEGLEDLIISDYATDSDYLDLEATVKKALQDVLDAIESLAEEARAENIDMEGDVSDDLYELFQDDVATWLSEFDTSKPLDIIPSHAEVEVAFVVDYGDLGLDDLMTHRNAIVSAIDTITPDSNFLRFLKLINLAPSEYIAICAEEGRDPSVAIFDGEVSDYDRRRAEELALQWQAVLDLERDSIEHISKLPLSGKYQIAEWNSRVDLAASIKDYDRPVALTNAEIVTVVDNATDGGVASFVTRLKLRDMVEGKFDKPFLATGGYVGLHDYINGSGYIETPSAPILIDPQISPMAIPSARKDRVNEVYGIVENTFRVQTTPYEAPEWRHAGQAKWVRKHDGGHVEILRRPGDDGAFDYYTQSFDANDGDPSLVSTYGPFADIEDAKTVWDSNLQSTSSPAP